MKSNFELFSSLWEKYHLFLYKYLYSRMANQYDAEDVLQTTALKAAKNFHKLKSPKDAKTWFFTIATNAMNDHFRKVGVRASKEALLSVDSAADERTHEFSDLKLTIDQYLDTLIPEKKNLIYLYMQKTLTLKEISGVLGIGYSTARKWLLEMREELSSEIFYNEDNAQ